MFSINNFDSNHQDYIPKRKGGKTTNEGKIDSNRIKKARFNHDGMPMDDSIQELANQNFSAHLEVIQIQSQSDQLLPTKLDQSVNEILILESAKQKILRVIERSKHLFKGVSQGAQPMGELYHAEYVDKQHRYGRKVNTFFNIWKDSTTTDGFNEWMEKLEQGKLDELGLTFEKFQEMTQKQLIGKDNKLCFMTKVIYLDENERKHYEMNINNGKAASTTEGVLHTADPLKHPHIFVVSPDKKVYVGTYEHGVMSHASFLSGAPILSSGELIIDNGNITTITDKSGHYTPCINGCYASSPEMVVKGLKVLKQQGVNLSDVKLILNSISEEASKQEFNALQFLLDAQLEELKNDPKNQGNMNREEAEKILAQAPDNAWLLRYSSSHKKYVVSKRKTLTQYEHGFVADKSLEEWKQFFSELNMLPKKT